MLELPVAALVLKQPPNWPYGLPPAARNICADTSGPYGSGFICLPIRNAAMKMTTEEAFVKTLQMHGIEHAFGIIGSAFMPIC